MRNNLWQKILDVGAFLLGASFGVAVVVTFAWSFLIIVSQHYSTFESASYSASRFDIVEILSVSPALIIGLASGFGGLHIFGKLRESKFRWLYSPLCLCGYCLMAIVFSAIQIYLNAISNSGP